MFFHHVYNNMKNKIPTILLIGVGNFGERHLETLKMLENKKKLSIAGAVVATTKTQKELHKNTTYLYGLKLQTNYLSRLTQWILLRLRKLILKLR